MMPNAQLMGVRHANRPLEAAYQSRCLLFSRQRENSKRAPQWGAREQGGEDFMATRTEPDFIDALLRQDEEELRAKKKRLRAFQGTLNEFRRAGTALADAASAMIEAGDVTRTEAARIFDLSKNERAVALPARPRSQPGVADTINDPTPTANEEPQKAQEQNTNLA